MKCKNASNPLEKRVGYFCGQPFLFCPKNKAHLVYVRLWNKVDMNGRSGRYCAECNEAYKIKELVDADGGELVMLFE